MEEKILREEGCRPLRTPPVKNLLIVTDTPLIFSLLHTNNHWKRKKLHMNSLESKNLLDLFSAIKIPGISH